MLVHVFSAPGWWAFSVEPSGANLPPDIARWELFKIIEMRRGEQPRIAVDSEAALDALETCGLYIVPSRSSDSDSAEKE